MIETRPPVCYGHHGLGACPDCPLRGACEGRSPPTSHIDIHNMKYPDDLHLDYLVRNGIVRRKDYAKVGGRWVYRLKTAAVPWRRRGPVPGSQRRCPNCGEPGHYRKTCPNPSLTQ